jgi:hypothetical protein
MTKKATAENIIADLNKLGFQYVSGEYVGDTTWFQVKCKNGHLKPMRVKYRKAYRCEDCYYEKLRSESGKPVIEAVEKQGFKFIGPFFNGRTPFKIQCPKGHIFEASSERALRKTIGCIICDKLSSPKHHNYFQIKLLENTEFVYVSGEYINRRSKIIVKCKKKGHSFEKDFGRIATFERGKCPKCREEDRNTKSKDKITKWLQENRPHLEILEHLSRRKCKLKCKKDGYVYTTGNDNFYFNNSNCPKCQGNAPYTSEEMKQEFVKIKYIPLEDPRNSKSKIKTLCPKGHEIKTSYNKLIVNGLRCRTCFQDDHASAGENELLDWVESLGVKVERHPKIFKHKKIYLDADGYLPDFKVAIEYNGLFYHNNRSWAFGRTKYKEFYKHKAAIKSNISLVQVWEDQWYEHRDSVKDLILYHLGKKKIEEVAYLNEYLKLIKNKNQTIEVLNDYGINLEKYSYRVDKILPPNKYYISYISKVGYSRLREEPHPGCRFVHDSGSTKWTIDKSKKTCQVCGRTKKLGNKKSIYYNSNKCKDCYLKTAAPDFSRFQAYLDSTSWECLTPQESIRGQKDPITLKCSLCQATKTLHYKSFLSKRVDCPHPTILKQSHIKSRIESLGFTVTLIPLGTGARTPLEATCHRCKSFFDNISIFEMSRGCPKCNRV